MRVPKTIKKLKLEGHDTWYYVIGMESGKPKWDSVMEISPELNSKRSVEQFKYNSAEDSEERKKILSPENSPAHEELRNMIIKLARECNFNENPFILEEYSKKMSTKKLKKDIEKKIEDGELAAATEQYEARLGKEFD